MFRIASYLSEIGQTHRAIRAFEKIVERDGVGDEAQMSLLKIGQLQLSALHDPPSATNTLETFLGQYPNSEWRSFAQQTLAQARDAERTP